MKNLPQLVSICSTFDCIRSSFDKEISVMFISGKWSVYVGVLAQVLISSTFGCGSKTRASTKAVSEATAILLCRLKVTASRFYSSIRCHFFLFKTRLICFAIFWQTYHFCLYLTLDSLRISQAQVCAAYSHPRWQIYAPARTYWKRQSLVIFALNF